MDYSEAKRTHDLFDEKGTEVGWIYKTDTGEPLIHFIDKKSADESPRLRIQPAVSCQV